MKSTATAGQKTPFGLKWAFCTVLCTAILFLYSSIDYIISKNNFGKQYFSSSNQHHDITTSIHHNCGSLLLKMSQKRRYCKIANCENFFEAKDHEIRFFRYDLIIISHTSQRSTIFLNLLKAIIIAQSYFI